MIQTPEKMTDGARFSTKSRLIMSDPGQGVGRDAADEYADASEREAALRRLVGLERQRWARARRKKDSREPSTIGNVDRKISAVQFVRSRFRVCRAAATRARTQGIGGDRCRSSAPGGARRNQRSARLVARRDLV